MHTYLYKLVCKKLLTETTENGVKESCGLLIGEMISLSLNELNCSRKNYLLH